jgi:hypothetical protein
MGDMIEGAKKSPALPLPPNATVGGRACAGRMKGVGWQRTLRRSHPLHP